jgi:hypothetical protein
LHGAPNSLWAERQGLLYTELIEHPHMLPYRFVSLGSDGAVTALKVICLSHHLSFDLSTRPEATNEEALGETIPRWIDAGGFVQVMNHPDIHIEPLFAFLEGLPRVARLDWTAAEAAEWWRRTHVDPSDAFLDDVLRTPSGRVAPGVTVEERRPDGSIVQSQIGSPLAAPPSG